MTTLQNLAVTLPKGGGNQKTSERIKQQDNTKSAQIYSNMQIFNTSMLHTIRQFTGSET